MSKPSRVVYRPGGTPTEPGGFVFKPPPPRPPLLLRIMGFTGKCLIGAGLLVAGFIVYQLWGTGLQYQRSQDSLRSHFSQTTTVPAMTTDVRPVPTTALVATTIPDPKATTVPTTQPGAAATEPVAAVKEGDPLADIKIPRIGLDAIVVAGVSRDDLRRGPGHYPDTPLPGQQGNAAIAGHRTTFGAPFGRVDELRPGDQILVSTHTGTFHYVVSAPPRIVEPTDLSVIAPTTKATLTLTSCHPRYSARERIVIVAELDEATSTAPAPPTPNAYVAGAPSTDPSEAVGPEANAPITHSDSLEALSGGWFSDSSAWFPAIGFGLLGAAILAAAIYVGRRWSRLVSAVAAAPLFLVALYFFYENVSRLVPPNL